ncbi:ARSD Arylsulfatase, partial [Brachypteracias leptosomus]|nr:ARSD Arylsulfatase [Brachypteracias leptosomus]
FRTPNIDCLAREGVKLTQHIAAASLCTPSRAAFLTGRYPIRSGMASNNRYRALQWNAGSGGLPANEITFARLLQQQGYTTGLIGKWHQGVNCESLNDHCHHPLNHGFGYFYGMPFTLLNNCQENKPPELDVALQDKLWLYSQIIILAVLTLTAGKLTGLISICWKITACFTLMGGLFFISWYSSYGFVQYWNCILMRNRDVTEQPMRLERTASLMLKEVVSFIKRDGPFLLFVSFLHVHTPLFTTAKFQGKNRNGLYGDNVEEMDWMVGKILDSLDQEGLRNHTFTYFASDHGGHLEAQYGSAQLGGWNGIYKGRRNTNIRYFFSLMNSSNFQFPLFSSAGKLFSNTGECRQPMKWMIIQGGRCFIIAEHRLSRIDILFLPSLVVKVKTEIAPLCPLSLQAFFLFFLPGGAIWKAHYVTPVFHPSGAGACYGKGICQCFGEGVTHHDPPLLFDLSRYPSEAKPLSADTEPLFDTVIRKIGRAIEEHRRTLTPVPEQLSLYNIVWKPWLQPCCGTFPFCWCDKEGD